MSVNHLNFMKQITHTASLVPRESSLLVWAWLMLMAIGLAGCTHDDSTSIASMPQQKTKQVQRLIEPQQSDHEQFNEIVETLCSPAMGGRGWGKPGLERAGDYLIALMRDDLKLPGGMANGGYAQLVATDEVDGKLVRSRNLVAMLPGRGAMAEQTVVLCAHYDHLGRGEYGSLAWRHAQWDDIDPLPVHAGADDNASGVAAAVLAMVRVRDALADVANRRTVALLLTTGEERGFIGLRYLAGSPQAQRSLAFDFNEIYAAINLDMVGRLGNNPNSNGLGIYHSEAWRPWQPAMVQANEGLNLRLQFSERPPGYGDEIIFHRLDIPAVLIHTRSHEQYHTPADTPETLDIEGAMQITQWVAQLTDVLATQE